MNNLVRFFASGFFSGMFPVFPGTVGSLVALLIAWFLKPSMLLIFLCSLLGVYICTKGESVFGEHDCSHIVYDEFCGIFIATWNLDSSPQYIVAFILFRLFDIWKPSLINKVQELPLGWGVMADDLLAGLVSRIIVAVLIYIGII